MLLQNNQDVHRPLSQDAVQYLQQQLREYHEIGGFQPW